MRREYDFSKGKRGAVLITKSERGVPKRKLFNEIAEGFEALAKNRQGKRKLRTHLVKLK